MRAWEEEAGLRHPAVLAASRRSEALLEALTPDQRALARLLLFCVSYNLVYSCIMMSAL